MNFIDIFCFDIHIVILNNEYFYVIYLSSRLCHVVKYLVVSTMYVAR
jgi:hypothetical protein